MRFRRALCRSPNDMNTWPNLIMPLNGKIYMNP